MYAESESEAESEQRAWNEMDADAPMCEQSSTRLAVMHLDWTRVRASDIYVILSSCGATNSSTGTNDATNASTGTNDATNASGGRILNVAIYSSEFGKQRLSEEERYGPGMCPRHAGRRTKHKGARHARSDDAQGDSESASSDSEDESDEVSRWVLLSIHTPAKLNTGPTWNIFFALKKIIKRIISINRGARGAAPPPTETEKIVVEKWCYFPKLYKKRQKFLEDCIENW